MNFPLIVFFFSCYIIFNYFINFLWTIIVVLYSPNFDDVISFCRLLIAYLSGLIVLWDVSEAKFLFVGGGKDLQLKNEADSAIELDPNLPDDQSEHHLEEKEISALCWASTDGSIIAVGYLNGDILFWNTSKVVSGKGQQTGQDKNVVKLELSSAERRLPVIVLHWSTNNESRADGGGRLFIYGGDEIGSEEVLTVWD